MGAGPHHRRNSQQATVQKTLLGVEAFEGVHRFCNSSGEGYILIILYSQLVLFILKIDANKDISICICKTHNCYVKNVAIIMLC